MKFTLTSKLFFYFLRWKRTKIAVMVQEFIVVMMAYKDAGLVML